MCLALLTELLCFAARCSLLPGGRGSGPPVDWTDHRGRDWTWIFLRPQGRLPPVQVTTKWLMFAPDLRYAVHYALGFWISSDLVLWHPNMKHQAHSPLNRWVWLAVHSMLVMMSIYIHCTVLFSWRPLVSSWMDAGPMASRRKICLWLSTSMRCVTRTWYDQTVWPDTAPIDPIHYS